jgi:hypothetical protein
MYTVEDHPPPASEFLLLPSLDSLYKVYVRNQVLPQPGDSRPVMSPLQQSLSQQMMKNGRPWETNMQKPNNSRMLQQLGFHTQQIIKATSTQDLDPCVCVLLTLKISLDKSSRSYDLKKQGYLCPIMTTRLSFRSKCTHSRQVNHRFAPCIGNLEDFSVILNVVPTMIGSLFHFGRSGFDLLSVYQSRL